MYASASRPGPRRTLMKASARAPGQRRTSRSAGQEASVDTICFQAWVSRRRVKMDRVKSTGLLQRCMRALVRGSDGEDAADQEVDLEVAEVELKRLRAKASSDISCSRSQIVIEYSLTPIALDVCLGNWLSTASMMTRACVDIQRYVRPAVLIWVTRLAHLCASPQELLARHRGAHGDADRECTLELDEGMGAELKQLLCLRMADVVSQTEVGRLRPRTIMIRAGFMVLLPKRRSVQALSTGSSQGS